MAKYNILSIANYIKDKQGGIISNKKLQKLLFYAYAWYLVENNSNSDKLKNKLFDSRIEAWEHGPVCPEAYYAFKERKLSKDETEDIDCETEDILDIVLDVYGDYSGDELEYFTHQEQPWKNARIGYEKNQRCNELIKDKDIYNYYSERIK